MRVRPALRDAIPSDGFGTQLLLASILLPPILLGVLVLRAVGLAPSADRVSFLGWAYVSGAVLVGLISLVGVVMADGTPDRRVPMSCAVSIGAPKGSS